MNTVRQLLRRPGTGARLIAAALTVAGLVPMLARLPKVAVMACFGAGHPLYQLVPQTGFVGTEHCLTAPAPVLGWTLMIASTFLVQLFGLPLVLTACALLVRGGRRLGHAAGKALTRVLGSLSDLLVPEQVLLPIPVAVRYRESGLSLENPRRGPPNR